MLRHCRNTAPGVAEQRSQPYSTFRLQFGQRALILRMALQRARSRSSQFGSNSKAVLTHILIRKTLLLFLVNLVPGCAFIASPKFVPIAQKCGVRIEMAHPDVTKNSSSSVKRGALKDNNPSRKRQRVEPTPPIRYSKRISESASQRIYARLDQTKRQIRLLKLGEPIDFKQRDSYLSCHLTTFSLDDDIRYDALS